MDVPASVSRSRILFDRHGFAAGLFLLVLFKLWLVHTEGIYGAAWTHDALWFVESAENWYWGSDYNWTAFIRPPAYPLFIAFTHLCHIPLRIGIELMQLAGYLALVAALRKTVLPRSVCLISFAVMILHPGSFQLNNLTMADTFYAALLPLTIGGLLLTLVTAKLMHATWAGIALAALWNTREESVLIPPMIVVFFIFALFQQRLATHSWNQAARHWLKPAGAILGTLFLLNSAVDTANYRAFHSFSKSQFTASNFRAAYKALLRIKPSHDQRFVAVSTDALQKAYSVSPTFAQIRPQLEGELGRNWQSFTFDALGIHEIGTPWLLWALRNAAAANSDEINKNAAADNRFYRNVAKEINRACDEGRVSSRFVLSSLLDPGAIANARHMPQSFPRIAALFLLQYHTMEGRDQDILTESQRTLYDEMTNRDPAQDHAGILGISTLLENFIGDYHRFFVVILSLAGFAAALRIAWRFRRLRASDSLTAALVLLAVTIFLRVLLFTFLDATWWMGGGYERYLFPVAPLYSCFLILLIYQSLTLGQRARQAI